MGSAKARAAAMMVSAAALSAAYPAMAQDDLANTLQGCWVQSKTGTLEHAEYALTITTNGDAVEATVPSRNRIYKGDIEDGKLTLTYTLKGAEDLADQSHWTGGAVPSEKIRAQIVEAQPTSRFVVNKVEADQIDVTHFGFLARWTASETLVHIEPKGFGYVWRRADALKPTALSFMTAGFKGEKDAFTTDDRAALVEAKASQGCDVQIETLTATLVHDAVDGVEKEIVLTETGADTNLFRSEGIALGEDFATLGTLTLSLVKGGPVAQVKVGKDAETLAAEKAAAEKAAAEKAAAEKAAAEKAAAEKAAAEKAAAEKAAAEKAEADEASADAGTPVQIIPSEDNPEPAAPAAEAETLQDPEALDEPAGETAETEAEPAKETGETEAEPAATEWVNPDAETKRPGIAPANANSFLTPKSEPAAPADEAQEQEAEPAAPAQEAEQDAQAEDAAPAEQADDEAAAQEAPADEVDEAAQAMNDAYRQAYDGWMADINKSKAKIKELEEAAFEADEVDVDGFNERAATERKRLKILEDNLVSDLKEAAAAFTESGRDVPQWITDALQ